MALDYFNSRVCLNRVRNALLHLEYFLTIRRVSSEEEFDKVRKLLSDARDEIEKLYHDEVLWRGVQMAFTKEQRIKGMKKALASPKTPERLKKGMREYLKRLQK